MTPSSGGRARSVLRAASSRCRRADMSSERAVTIGSRILTSPLREARQSAVSCASKSSGCARQYRKPRIPSAGFSPGAGPIPFSPPRSYVRKTTG